MKPVTIPQMIALAAGAAIALPMAIVESEPMAAGEPAGRLHFFGMSETLLGFLAVIAGAFAASMYRIHRHEGEFNRHLLLTDGAGFLSAAICGLGVFPLVYEMAPRFGLEHGESAATSVGFAHGVLGYQLIPMITGIGRKVYRSQVGDDSSEEIGQ